MDPINPTKIETSIPKAQYIAPFYRITNKGPEKVRDVPFNFCKGNREDPEAFRQDGFFTETVIALAIRYLQENNVGELTSRETSIAITHFETGLLWLQKRSNDRKAAGVQATYRPTPDNSQGIIVTGKPEGPDESEGGVRHG